MKNCYIYGLSGHGRRLFRYLKLNKFSEINIKGFLDLDKAKHNSNFGNIPILNPDILYNNDDYDFIYLVGRNILEIKKFLINTYGISEKKLLILGRSEYPPSQQELDVREKDILIILEDLLKLFDSEKIKYWMDTSGLLPLFRNQKLSEFSDVDIAILSSDSNKIKDKITNLSNSDCKVEFKYFEENTVFCIHKSIKQIIVTKEVDKVKYEPVIIDIHLEYELDDLFYREIEGKLIKVQKKYRTDGSLVQYDKLFLSVPQNSKKYLESLYGKDWQTPDDFWTNRYKEKI